jgi:hypothetical protein
MELMVPRDENSGPVGMGLQMGGRGPNVHGLAGRVHESLKSSNPPSKGRAFGTPLGGKGGEAAPGKQRKALGNITNQTQTPARRALGDITNSKASGSKPGQQEALKPAQAEAVAAPSSSQSLVERYAVEGVEGWAGGATGHQLAEAHSRRQDAKLKAKVAQLTIGGGDPLQLPAGWGSDLLSDEEVMRINGGDFDPDLVDIPALSLDDFEASDSLLDDFRVLDDDDALLPMNDQSCALGVSLAVAVKVLDDDADDNDVDMDLDDAN